ncbi:MAG: MurR/RpiR family transcriptional regulator [Pseudomonadota bacterium]
MTRAAPIEDRITENYTAMSSKLRKAADFVADNPVDVATRSLRSVAASSGVSPATFSRLARVLGYDDYEEMREAGRAAVGQRLVPFSERAEAIRRGDQSAAYFIHRQAAACIQNIDYLEQNLQPERLQEAVDLLFQANKVLLIGALGSAGIVEYFAYQAQFLARDWTVAGRGGASIAASFAQMQADDAVIVLTKSPYSGQALSALRLANQNGFKTLVLTDSHSSPALEYADRYFVIPTEAANFFSSYAATLVLIETMMSMLIAKVGPDAEARIKATEEQTRRLGENWSA